MSRARASAFILAVVIVAIPCAAQQAASPSNLSGRWALNRSLSQFPKDVGFGMDIVSTPGAKSQSDDPSTGAAGSAGRPGSGISGLPESEEDARRRELLVGVVRTPSTRLTIAQTAGAVTITDARGRVLTFHPDGRVESQMFDGVPVTTVSRWDGARLEVRYRVQPGRELHYTFSRSATPQQLVVQVVFVERGGRDTITRVYDPATGNEPAETEAAAPARATGLPAAARRTEPIPEPEAPRAPEPARSPAQRPWTPGEPAPGQAPPPQGGLGQGVPVSPDRAAGTPIAQGPDVELKGITALGVVVEDLSSQATACGLKQATLEATVEKGLTDAGFSVARNTDEDTYVYVNVMTMTPSPGFCISRFDVYVYTNTTATLSYQTVPVLVQVSLLHRGGIAGGGPAAHADSVMKGVKQYVDEFAARIKKAGR
jgi:hypothetical protein